MKNDLQQFFACMKGISFRAMTSGRLDFFTDDGTVFFRFDVQPILDLINDKYEVSEYNWHREYIRELLRAKLGAKPYVRRLGGRSSRCFDLSVIDVLKSTGVWVFPEEPVIIPEAAQAVDPQSAVVDTPAPAAGPA